MQGGFLAAAFDNTFGPLSYLAARRPCSTLDMHINFIRPVKEGERLTVTARVVSRSAVALHLAAEAFNGQGKLVGTSSSQMIVNRQS
jgi:acyl-coenzyme A thioesterase PaaI-like protein